MRGAANMVMSVLTEFGIKMVLPLGRLLLAVVAARLPSVTRRRCAVLKALDDQSWRKQIDSIAMLGELERAWLCCETRPCPPGAMSHCAPNQLSACLPQIVPKLLNTMQDPHAKVQEAAR